MFVGEEVPITAKVGILLWGFLHIRFGRCSFVFKLNRSFFEHKIRESR